MASRRALWLALLLPAIAAGIPERSHAGKKEMDLLQSDVDELQRQVYDLKRALDQQGENLRKMLELLDTTPGARSELAAFNANVDALRREVRELGSRFDATASAVSGLERRIAGCCEALPTLSSPSEPAPTTPSLLGGEPGLSPREEDVLYQQAYGDYLKDHFDLAISQFREFMEKHPGSDLADNAQYWIGMSYFNQRDFAAALRELDAMLMSYPTGDNAPEALYRKGLALLELNRLGQAVLALNDVVSRFPDTPAATQAQTRLKELASGAR